MKEVQYIQVSIVNGTEFEMNGTKMISLDKTGDKNVTLTKEIADKVMIPLLSDDNTVTKDMVDNFISTISTMTLGDKTTVVRATLQNGFEIIESSSCVDKKNYSEEIGKELCLETIETKVWELLGFILQTATRY